MLLNVFIFDFYEEDMDINTLENINRPVQMPRQSKEEKAFWCSPVF